MIEGMTEELLTQNEGNKIAPNLMEIKKVSESNCRSQKCSLAPLGNHRLPFVTEGAVPAIPVMAGSCSTYQVLKLLHINQNASHTFQYKVTTHKNQCGKGPLDRRGSRKKLTKFRGG